MAYHDVVALSAQTANAVTFLAGRDRLDRFGDSVVQSQEDVADASVTLDARRGDWSAAAQRVSALERLYERHTDARHADFLATEVQDTDERTMQRGLNALNQSKSLGELQ